MQCEYCGNQRSVKAAKTGAVIEDQVFDLLNFEKSTRFNERQKAALAYAEAIAWHLDTDDAFWDRLHKHFSEPELVELGCMIGLTLGQQSWLRLLNIDHHEVMAGTDASMAPGFEDAQSAGRHQGRGRLLGEVEGGIREERLIARAVDQKTETGRGNMQGLYINDASWLDTAGRLLIVAFFLIVGIRNLSKFHIEDHIKRLTLCRHADAGGRLLGRRGDRVRRLRAAARQLAPGHRRAVA